MKQIKENALDLQDTVSHDKSSPLLLFAGAMAFCSS